MTWDVAMAIADDTCEESLRRFDVALVIVHPTIDPAEISNALDLAGHFVHGVGHQTGTLALHRTYKLESRGPFFIVSPNCTMTPSRTPWKWQHNMLQSEAGYINARPHLPDRRKPLATHGRTIHAGQNRKSSMRANVFRCSPNNGHRQDTSVCPFRADFVAEIGIPTARDGWCIF